MKKRIKQNKFWAHVNIEQENSEDPLTDQYLQNDVWSVNHNYDDIEFLDIFH